MRARIIDESLVLKEELLYNSYMDPPRKKTTNYSGCYDRQQLVMLQTVWTGFHASLGKKS